MTTTPVRSDSNTLNDKKKEFHGGITFIELRDLESLYLPISEDVGKWIEYLEDNSLKTSLYAVKNKKGEFMPLVIDDDNVPDFHSQISFKGEFKDLLLNGYKPYKSSATTSYCKGEVHHSIWIAKSESVVVIHDLYSLSGAFYLWLIDNDFNEKHCTQEVFISVKSGQVRRSSGLLFDNNGMPNEIKYHATIAIVEELRRLYKAGGQLEFK